MNDQGETRESIFQSPYYWAYLFLVAAIAVLLVAQPRIQQRQAQIETKLQGRQRAVRGLAGQPQDTPLSRPEATKIQLGPLLTTLLILLAIASLGLASRFWIRRRPSLPPRGEPS